MSKANSAKFINNYRLEELYNHKIENNRFFRVVFKGDDIAEIRLSSKIFMQIKFIPKRNDIEGITIKKLMNGVIREKISFSRFNFEQLQLFLNFINDLDLNLISERRLKLADNSLDILDDETKKRISTLLQGNEGADLIQSILDNETITSQDIVNTGYRKNQLKIFKRLLDNKDNFIEEYKKQESGLNKDTKEELVWQYFFNKNQWIFGYGLNYRFQSILQKEFSASDTDAAGKDQVNADFLLGDDNFTTFVEIKKPTSKIFNNSRSGQNRSNSWKLSNELIHSVSQILEQKASGQIKLERKDLHDEKGYDITQNSYDSKCILVFGNLEKELDTQQDSPKTRKIKKKTFELFRRDSRNIEIITYEELYKRAYFICNKSD